MLYSVEIDAKTIKDKDALTQKLYIFLRQYVPAKLIYEDTDTIEDCIQDTIIFILQRLKELEAEIRVTNPLQLITFNYEKWVYNRARSYTSFWIKRKSNKKRRHKEYVENVIYFMDNEPDIFIPDKVDSKLLEDIALSYKLNTNDTRFLLKTMEEMLVNIGYRPTDKYEGLKVEEEIQHIVLIAYAAVDEYIYESGSSSLGK